MYPKLALQSFCLSFPNTRVIGIHDHIYFYIIIYRPLEAAWSGQGI